MSSPTRFRRTAVTIGAVLSASLTFTACSGTPEAGETNDGTINVWAHTGQAAETKALQAIVEDFNSSQEDVTAKLTLIPEADYTSTIQAPRPRSCRMSWRWMPRPWRPSPTTAN